VTSVKPRDTPLRSRWRDFRLRKRYVEALKLWTSSVLPCFKKSTTNATQRYRSLTCFIADGNGGDTSIWLRTDFHVSKNRHFVFEYGNGFILTNLVFITYFLCSWNTGEDLNVLLNEVVSY